MVFIPCAGQLVSNTRNRAGSGSRNLYRYYPVRAPRRTVMPNHAFESGRAEERRAFGLHPWRRAAQRER